eukprot:CAMPEP_0175073228 /NCGR_PEP_ID=MMETSP0052_2-20121109/20411_1 /TAXON_ID=51329 ORGANISM="Polytomella parva, Strain SAG 63-3" /NCGR_SAMPLE_ID=MMETSP0052_2 /ASSEMBLY_ACC=CAM_ASM_000194 /LENGTH=253 /DNA_ID=CAMNT_0016340945 /DNA_START=41 /DNA_END=798 /DNA_ORIENTATION=-
MNSEKERVWNKIKGIISNLNQRNNLTWCFKEPVDEILHSAPGYYKVVRDPQDLGTIFSRLQSNYYRDPSEVMQAVKTMIDNCYLYNGPDNFMRETAKKFWTSWMDRWSKSNIDHSWSFAMVEEATRQALDELSPAGHAPFHSSSSDVSAVSAVSTGQGMKPRGRDLVDPDPSGDGNGQGRALRRDDDGDEAGIVEGGEDREDRKEFERGKEGKPLRTTTPPSSSSVSEYVEGMEIDPDTPLPVPSSVGIPSSV